MEHTSDIRDKISKLLALADSPNEHEAQVALLKARALMAEHKLRPEDITAKVSTKVIKRMVGISCTAMTNPWAAILAGIIATHYCCKAFRSHRPGGKENIIGFIGLEDDFAVCEKVFSYAYDCACASCKRIRSIYQSKRPAADIRKACNAYGLGFCKGLSSALEEQTRQHQEYGLVLVVPKAVTDAAGDIGKATAYGSNSTDWRNRDFVARGYQDGKAFDPSSKLYQPEDPALALG